MCKKVEVLDESLVECLKTTGHLVEKFKTQINMYDKNKSDFNFIFMFASPNYIRYNTPLGSKKVPFARLNNKEEFERIK